MGRCSYLCHRVVLVSGIVRCDQLNAFQRSSEESVSVCYLPIAACLEGLQPAISGRSLQPPMVDCYHLLWKTTSKFLYINFGWLITIRSTQLVRTVEIFLDLEVSS